MRVLGREGKGREERGLILEVRHWKKSLYIERERERGVNLERNGIWLDSLLLRKACETGSENYGQTVAAEYYWANTLSFFLVAVIWINLRKNQKTTGGGTSRLILH